MSIEDASLPAEEMRYQQRLDWDTARAAYPNHHLSMFLTYSDTDNAWIAGYRACLADQRAKAEGNGNG